MEDLKNLNIVENEDLSINTAKAEVIYTPEIG